MRNLTPVYLALVLASAAVSVLLWRDLQTEHEALQRAQQESQAQRQLADTLRAQLAEAKAARAASPEAPVPAAAALQPVATAKSAATAKPAVDIVAQVAEGAKQQKSLLEDSGYRKARLAELHSILKLRNPLLARELGISEQEAEAILDVMAEAALRDDALTAELLAAGTAPDASVIASMQRQQREQQQQDKNRLAAMLGATKYEQLQDIQQTQLARTRMVNLRNLLSQSGQPLTNEQSLALTRVVADQQKREEKESRELRAAGQYAQVSQVDRAVEGDRRILADAARILNAQQLETVRARFEQRQAMEHASGTVQSRERQLGQDSP